MTVNGAFSLSGGGFTAPLLLIALERFGKETSAAQEHGLYLESVPDGIPPLAADKTAFRTNQAWQIRALGPSFHAVAEIHTGGWRSWVSANNSTWYQAGVEARRRMAAAGFDVTLGDTWIVNEFPSTVISGLGPARANMRELVHGLYDGDGGPPTKGGVFDIGVGQGTLDLSTYKGQLEAWLQVARSGGVCA